MIFDLFHIANVLVDRFLQKPNVIRATSSGYRLDKKEGV